MAVGRLASPQFALRSDDGVEVGILGGDIVVRCAGWLARALRESCPPWRQEVLFVAERRLPMVPATAGYTGSVMHGRVARHRPGEQVELTASSRALAAARRRTSRAGCRVSSFLTSSSNTAWVVAAVGVGVIGSLIFYHVVITGHRFGAKPEVPEPQQAA